MTVVNHNGHYAPAGHNSPAGVTHYTDDTYKPMDAVKIESSSEFTHKYHVLYPITSVATFEAPVQWVSDPKYVSVSNVEHQSRSRQAPRQNTTTSSSSSSSSSSSGERRHQKGTYTTKSRSGYSQKKEKKGCCAKEPKRMSTTSSSSWSTSDVTSVREGDRTFVSHSHGSRSHKSHARVNESQSTRRPVQPKKKKGCCGKEKETVHIEESHRRKQGSRYAPEGRSYAEGRSYPGTSKSYVQY